MEEKASSDRRKFSRSLPCPWGRWVEATAAEGLGDYASRPIRDGWMKDIFISICEKTVTPAPNGTGG